MSKSVFVCVRVYMFVFIGVIDTVLDTVTGSASGIPENHINRYPRGVARADTTPLRWCRENTEIIEGSGGGGGGGRIGYKHSKAPKNPLLV